MDRNISLGRIIC
jgi:hypothetical protein